MTFTSNDARPGAPNEFRSTPVSSSRSAGYLDSAYLDWAAVIGGALVAVAIFTTLMVFGSAIGLSLTSTDPTHGVSAKFAAIAVGLWAAWVAASSFAAGGFITGRLRHRIADASVEEVEMRDGLHGLIGWALAALIGSAILSSAIGTPAAAAWIAAVVGGRHRDGGHAYSPMTSWGENWHRFGRKGTTHG